MQIFLDIFLGLPLDGDNEWTIRAGKTMC